MPKPAAIAFDPVITPCVTKARAATLCGTSVDAVNRAVELLNITLYPTPAGRVRLLRPIDVRLLVEHFAARRR